MKLNSFVLLHKDPTNEKNNSKEKGLSLKEYESIEAGFKCRAFTF